MGDRKALAAVRKLAKKEPTLENLMNLVEVLMDCREYDAAMGELARCLAMDDKDPQVWAAMGACALAKGEYDKVAPLYQRALQCYEMRGVPPASSSAILPFAESMLRLGQFEYAWPVYEGARFNRTWHPFPSIPAWRGDPTDSLIVLPEGSIADLILFSRWMPALASRIERVLWLVPDPMFEYLKFVCPKGAAAGLLLPMSHQFQFADLEPYRFCTSLKSLPAYLGMKNWNAIPRPLNWEPPARVIAAPQDWIAVSGFHGGPNVPPWTEIEKVFKRKCEKVVHLQADLPKNPAWDEAARLLLKCRAVVALDDPFAHLAGSLGVKTLCLLERASSWIWGAPPENEPNWVPNWYGPTFQVYRNQSAATWDRAKILDLVKNL